MPLLQGSGVSLPLPLSKMRFLVGQPASANGWWIILLFLLRKPLNFLLKKEAEVPEEPNSINRSSPTGWVIKELNQLTGNTLLVIGGSQGAKGLNQFVLDHKTSIMAAGYNIIHLAGPKFFDSNAPQFIKERHHNLGYLALPYANQMVSLYQKASLVMCRSGATTLTELDHFGLPAILVPFPFSKDDHQVANADAFAEKIRMLFGLKRRD